MVLIKAYWSGEVHIGVFVNTPESSMPVICRIRVSRIPWDRGNVRCQKPVGTPIGVYTTQLVPYRQLSTQCSLCRG